MKQGYPRKAITKNVQQNSNQEISNAFEKSSSFEQKGQKQSAMRMKQMRGEKELVSESD